MNLSKIRNLLNLNTSGSTLEQQSDSNTKPKTGDVSDLQNSPALVSDTLEINVVDDIIIEEILG